MKKTEKMIYARGRWEFATIEVNPVTQVRQWIRRDMSFICNVGKETLSKAVPPKPKKEKAS